MKKWDTLIDELKLDNRLALEDIPDVDLYMDQVIQLFEKKFASSKRNEDEKILTKTMINNYAKGQLFIPIKNKRYTKNHLMLISMVYQLKGALSIKDIQQLLNRLNDKIMDEHFELEDLYERFLELIKENADHFKEDVMIRAENVRDELDTFKEDDDIEYLEHLLMAASFVNMSNLYRRAAEKLVDDLDVPQEKQK